MSWFRKLGAAVASVVAGVGGSTHAANAQGLSGAPLNNPTLSPAVSPQPTAVAESDPAPASSPSPTVELQGAPTAQDVQPTASPAPATATPDPAAAVTPPSTGTAPAPTSTPQPVQGST